MLVLMGMGVVVILGWLFGMMLNLLIFMLVNVVNGIGDMMLVIIFGIMGMIVCFGSVMVGIDIYMFMLFLFSMVYIFVGEYFLKICVDVF